MKHFGFHVLPEPFYCLTLDYKVAEKAKQIVREV